MNITCLFCTWLYSCIWLRKIVIFGARTWAYRSWYGLPLGYIGATRTIREAAKNNWKSVSERLVQAIEGERERENTRPPENKKQGKVTKNKKNKFGTPQKEKGKSPTPKREDEENKKQGKETKNKRNKFGTPQNEGENSNIEKREKNKQKKQRNSKRKKRKKRRENKRKKEVTQLISKKKRHEERKKNKKVFAHLRLS